MDFSFFTVDNKSGYKTKESWLSKNHPQLYTDIIEYCENLKINLSFKEKIYFFFNKLTERPKCLTCNSEIKFRDRFDKPYGEFCSVLCINSNKTEMLKRIKKTMNDNYGVDYYPQHDEFLTKQKLSKLLKFGDENYNNHEKGKNTKLEKYGDFNYNNHDKYKQTCIDKYGNDNFSKSTEYKNQTITSFKKTYDNINIIDVIKDNVTILCDKCDSYYIVTKQLIYERNKRNYEICTVCNPIGQNQRSGYENEICDFFNEKNIKYIPNKRISYGKSEIDIFLPDYSLGIEFNGLYWHNELFKDKNYHLNKTNLCNENKIELIHIFEDEWIYKKDIVKSILNNRIGFFSNKIYARKCDIREISSNDSKMFLNNNHIQGNVNSKVRIGLFYENNLVSLMTFSSGRIIMGGKKTEWELNRFCNLINFNVIGGASKLLKYFIKKYTPEKIISYSDIRIFNGGMYEKLGFVKISQSKPNYWYIINDIRKHRFNYRKSILIKEGYDKNLTEQEIMFNRKIYRIYDCGNIRWEYNLTT
jgi:hypothetical protein